MEYLISVVLALAFGTAFYYLSLYQIKIRCSDEEDNQKLLLAKRKWVLPLWLVSAVVVFAVTVFVQKDLWPRIHIMLFSLFALNIATVDFTLRRIPNASLIALLLLQCVNIGISVYGGEKFSDLAITCVVGFVMGFIVCSVPAMFKISMGSGDIKYSAVIGFTLGLTGYAQAMVIMAVCLLVYLIYLRVTKKGGLRTSAPMGPYLSVGAVVTMLYPFVALLSGF